MAKGVCAPNAWACICGARRAGQVRAGQAAWGMCRTHAHAFRQCLTWQRAHVACIACVRRQPAMHEQDWAVPHRATASMGERVRMNMSMPKWHKRAAMHPPPQLHLPAWRVWTPRVVGSWRSGASSQPPCMHLLPFTANTKPGGVASAHCRYDDARCKRRGQQRDVCACGSCMCSTRDTLEPFGWRWCKDGCVKCATDPRCCSTCLHACTHSGHDMHHARATGWSLLRGAQHPCTACAIGTAPTPPPHLLTCRAWKEPLSSTLLKMRLLKCSS